MRNTHKSSRRRAGYGSVSVGDLAAASGSIRTRAYRTELAIRLKRLLRDSSGDIRQEAARALTRLALY